MRQYVPEEQLWTEFSNGSLEFEYDHSVYWPALVKLCEEKRASRTERWIAGGKHIGEYEDYLAGGRETGVGAEMEQNSAGLDEKAKDTAAAATNPEPAKAAAAS